MLTKKGKGELFFVITIALFFCTIMYTNRMVFAQDSTEEKTGRVLFISSYSYAWDTVPLQMEGIKESIGEEASIDYEFMNTKLVNDEESLLLFHDKLQYDLEHVAPYDVVIVGDDAALDFVLQYQSELFSETPIVFEGINDLEAAESAAEDPMITGVVEELSYDDNITTAMEIMPDATKIVAIVDNTITGTGEKKQFYANKDKYPNLSFEELNASELTKEEFQEQLASYGEDTILFYLICSEDVEGNKYSANEVLELIQNNANTPVFRLVQSGIGNGVIGGKVVSHKESGAIAGEMAVEILNGTPVSEIEEQMTSPNFFYFDAGILEKYGISTKILPKDTIYVNEEPSFWVKYSKTINRITILTIMVLLFMGLLAALAYLKQRTKVLEALEKKNLQLGEAIETAEQANIAKSTFLSRMSHEIRTPMNAILGLTSITRNHVNNPERVSENLDKIEVSSKMLLNIINDVLDMSAIESNKIQISHNPFDLKQLLTSISLMYYPLCKKKGISFDMVLNSVTEEQLIGDQLRLNQILNNLLSNALKFTEQGGIRVEIRQKDVNDKKVYIQFIVSDTGCGMSEDMLGRIFKPFEQENSQTALNHGGSGLGMSITKNLIDLMHGAINVKSEKEKGTTFTVSLPFEVAEVTEGDKKKNIKRLKVLAVDDETNTREYLDAVLTHIGVDHYVVDSGKAALDELKIGVNSGRPYDVVFVDWQMPQMDGVSLIRKIREMYSKDMLLVITSAYDLSEIEEEGKRAGTDMFLSKPLFQSTVFDVLMGLSGGAYTRRTADESSYDFGGKSILLVDDTEFNLEVAADLLQMVNLKVTCAQNGKEALNLVEKSEVGTFDLILMDVQMPILNGHEATKRIRALNKKGVSDIPILAMTANAFTEDIAASISAGMNDHITKPIDTKTLYQTIDKYLAR